MNELRPLAFAPMNMSGDVMTVLAKVLELFPCNDSSDVVRRQDNGWTVCGVYRRDLIEAALAAHNMGVRWRIRKMLYATGWTRLDKNTYENDHDKRKVLIKQDRIEISEPDEDELLVAFDMTEFIATEVAAAVRRGVMFKEDNDSPTLYDVEDDLA